MDSTVPELTLAEAWAYARCPFRYFWRYKARIVPPPTARDLLEKTVRLTLSLHYGGTKDSLNPDPDQPGPLECLGAVWRAMLEDWGLGDATWALLEAYASRRVGVSEPFLDGRATEPDHSLHGVPGLGAWDEMSAGQERRSALADPSGLAQQLRECLSRVPVRTTEDCGALEAFAESVAVLERNKWPARDVGEGVGYPYEVDLIGGRTLKATADLVLRAENGAITIEVHDYEKPKIPPAALVRRDMRVVAAAHASGQAWTHVREVVYRHMLSGATVSISAAAGTGRLLTALIGAVEGIRHQVYVPRLAVEPRVCRSCPYEELCIQDHQDILDTLDPTMLGATR